jgi:hypothetical protein
VPDVQQLVVLAFALVPGFIASEVQSFVALRRRPPALATTLIAIGYSAVLYSLATVGQWGPQYDPAFDGVASGSSAAAVLTTPSLLLRYLALITAAILLGLITGRSLARGYARKMISRIAGRNVIGSTWQEFLHDRPAMGLWAELRDGRRLIGQVTNASDSTEETIVVLAWPRIVAQDNRTEPMGLDAILLDTKDCTLLGVLPSSEMPKLDQPDN